jgi:DNA helicase-2/ATP-dependent DNA helicase PcrA
MLHGQMRYGLPSRFLEELPENLLKRVNASRSAAFAAESSTSEEPPHAASGQIPWRIGQNVVHPKFGPGVIVNSEGRGADARVQVRFREAGVKWLALEYARLEAV